MHHLFTLNHHNYLQSHNNTKFHSLTNNKEIISIVPKIISLVIITRNYYMKAQLLLLITALFPSCRSDSSTVWISSTQCTFYFQDNHHSSFTICLIPSFSSYSWNECFTRCCNSPSPSFFPSKQSL